jgi:hypothetical protein
MSQAQGATWVEPQSLSQWSSVNGAIAYELVI